MTEIPTKSDQVDYNYNLDIAGTTYFLRFRYNSRMKRYMLDILDLDKTVIIAGLPILSSVPTIEDYVDIRLPAGVILPFDNEGQQKNAEVRELGDRVRIYFEANE